ncbi:hypothetical protein [Ruminococcus sp.]|uniref:hypothetical protein n=1 Tax=Ruminococcus sp. TaxID=41978 RepID=UPI0025F0E3B5|nr:hypothetical protein [Ruminococcus sp.]MBQ8968091.1 hypothetical protein [Ruminococcus sp.]
MNKRFILFLAAVMAVTAVMAGCGDNRKKTKTKTKPKNAEAVSDAEGDGDEEEEVVEIELGVLKDYSEAEPSVIKGLILEPQTELGYGDSIETMAEEGFTKEPPVYEFGIDEVFEMYIDTDVDDPWHVYICRHEDVDGLTSLDEDTLAELSEKDGCSNTIGNTPDREYYGDIGGMCVASDISSAGEYDMFFVRGGKIDSYIILELTPAAEDQE